MGRTYGLRPQLGPALTLQNMRGLGRSEAPFVPRAWAITASGVLTVLASIYYANWCTPSSLSPSYSHFKKPVPNSRVSMERLIYVSKDKSLKGCG